MTEHVGVYIAVAVKLISLCPGQHYVNIPEVRLHTVRVRFDRSSGACVKSPGTQGPPKKAILQTVFCDSCIFCSISKQCIVHIP